MPKLDSKNQASTLKRYELTKADLPLACPMPNQPLWNAHPRVYLPIEKTGEATCPYCGAMYTLKNCIEAELS